MKILIIGGTIFLGRHLVNAALENGHEVTMFNRGQHNPELFPDVEKMRGDRKVDIEALKNRKWHAVIDTCGYAPSIVNISAEYLKDSVNKYVFISSVSVYNDFSDKALDENSPVGKLETDTEEVTGETYGPLKVLCENKVKDIYGERALIIRPGLIVGPDDPSDRFTYWVTRINKGGEVLVPDAKNTPVQYIDVRDLAEWTIKLIEDNRSGTYNATGPNETITFEQMVTGIDKAIGGKAKFSWVSEKFLEDNEVAPWSDLPVWLPAEIGGMSAVSSEKGIKHGLRSRSLEEIAKDTLAWTKQRKANYNEKEGLKIKAGISPEREKDLLEKWKESNNN